MPPAERSALYYLVYVVFKLNRSFYPTLAVHSVSVLILHPRDKMAWSQTATEKKLKMIAN